MSSNVEHVVVLGGSMAGLLAARAVSETAGQVTIYERDEVLGVDGPRRGVPQGRHVHGLLARGQQILEELFPGFTQEAIESGVPTGDLGELRWFFGGKKLQPKAADCLCVSADRPALEHLVRERVRGIPNVEIKQHHEVADLIFTDDDSEVIGVEVRDLLDAANSSRVTADLVIDALGRGSRSPRWLREHGYGEVAEDTIRIGLTYTSRHYRVTDESVLQGDLSVNPVSTPATPRGAFFSRVQGNDGRSIISLTGVLGDEPPDDPAGFEAWAASMEIPDVHEIIQAGEAIDDPTKLTFPRSVRRRYDLLEKLPAGLIFLGDSLCSFNPVYGQGMTVAALEAHHLRSVIGSGVPDSREFTAQAASIVEGPWQASAGGDLAFFDGPVPPEVEQANSFMASVQDAASRDPEVTRQFMRVAGLVDPPSELMTPDMLNRILGPEAAQQMMSGVGE